MSQPETDCLESGEVVLAVQDQLLARVTGLLVAAGIRSSRELVLLAIQPAKDMTEFWRQSNIQWNRSAAVTLAIGLQVAVSKGSVVL